MTGITLVALGMAWSQELPNANAGKYLQDYSESLSASGEAELARVLEAHSDASHWDIFLVIFGSSSSAMPAASADSMGFLVRYELDQPSSTQISILNDSVPLTAPVVESLRDSCTRVISEGADPEAQLIQFAEQLTKQVAKLEAAVAQAQALQATGENQVEPPKGPALQLLVFTKFGLLVVLGIGLVGVSILKIRKALRPKNLEPMQLPSVEIHPRLGARYGGGGHAMMSFGNVEETTFFWRLNRRLQRVTRGIKQRIFPKIEDEEV